jgi:hypothetical protein
MTRVALAKLHAAAPHRKPGYLDAVMAVAKDVSETHITLEAEDFARLRREYASQPRKAHPAPQPPAPSHGPGTELKALLKDWLGIESSPTCSCNKMAAKMNAAGPDWCETDAGLAEILGVMRAEHGKRWADGGTRLPWSDFGATQLVRLACRRARAKAAS